MNEREIWNAALEAAAAAIAAKWGLNAPYKLAHETVLELKKEAKP